MIRKESIVATGKRYRAVLARVQEPNYTSAISREFSSDIVVSC